MKLLLVRKMNFALLSALISLAFVSQVFAVLRPLVPAKPTPPCNGELIIIEDNSIDRKRSTRPFLFHWPFGNREDDGSGSDREKISSRPLHISGVRPVSTPLAQSSRVYFGGFAPDFPRYISGKEFKKNENQNFPKHPLAEPCVRAFLELESAMRAAPASN